MLTKKLFRWVLRLILLMILLSGIELLRSNYALTVSRYDVNFDQIAAPIRVVFLSDLHGREFGTHNQRLLNIIIAQEPDLIALVGDIIDRDATAAEIDEAYRFVLACTEIAPVYYSMGNHESELSNSNAANLHDRLAEAGANVLNNNYLDLTVNGSDIRIGGYMGFYPYPHMMTKDPEQIKLEQSFFADFKDTDHFKLLLNHIPTGWLDWEYRDHDSVDLVLCGHYHGGVVRIPILEQGLYAPYVGKFPPYTKGIFVGKKATCILTTGLAGSYGIPRFFNPPEICLVVLSPGQSRSDPASP